MDFLADRVSQISLSEIRKMYLLANDNTLDLGLGQLGFKAPQLLIDAGVEAFKSNLGYTPNAGIPELRKAIAEEVNNEQGFKINASNVLVTTGVEEGLFVIMGSLLNPGDQVLIPEIYFSAYPTIGQIFGAEVVEYGLDTTFEINVEDLVQKVSDKTKLIIINSPSNPTGAVQSDSTLKKLAAVADEHHLLILSDEIYSKLVYSDEKPVSILKYTKNAIVVNGISKRSAAAGLRLGWILAEEKFINAFLPFHQYAVTSASVVAQHAALPVVKGQCRNEEVFYRKTLQQQRDWVIQEMSEYIAAVPQGAFYILLQCGHIGPSKAVAKKLLKEINVLTIPGIAFGPAADEYLRISFAGEFDVLKKGVKLIRNYLNSH